MSDFLLQPNVPVVLPVDHAETRRLTDQHELLKLVCRGNYWGPVKEILKYDSEASRRPRVLHVVSNSPWCVSTCSYLGSLILIGDNRIDIFLVFFSPKDLP